VRPLEEHADFLQTLIEVERLVTRRFRGGHATALRQAASG
jgi:hypothetical protein